MTYNRHRYYSTDTGRFISQDPIGFNAGDANLYRYVGNGVTSATDPSGLIEDDEEWKLPFAKAARRELEAKGAVPEQVELDGAWGWSKRAFGAVAKHTPIVVTGYVYYTEGDIGRALAESTPLSWSLEGSRALGVFYEYVEQEIEDTAFENHYSEGLWMKLAHSRQGQYERAKAQRDFERDCNRD